MREWLGILQYFRHDKKCACRSLPTGTKLMKTPIRLRDAGEVQLLYHSPQPCTWTKERLTIRGYIFLRNHNSWTRFVQIGDLATAVKLITWDMSLCGTLNHYILHFFFDRCHRRFNRVGQSLIPFYFMFFCWDGTFPEYSSCDTKPLERGTLFSINRLMARDTATVIVRQFNN